jgi:hypothetical protein
MLAFYAMHALVVTLLLLSPSLAGSDGLLDDDNGNNDQQHAARIERDRCLGAGAAGAVGVALGLVVGGAIGYGLGAAVQAADVGNTTISKNVDSFAIPGGALAGAVIGAAVGTIGAYDLTGDLADKPSVMR